MKIDGRDTDPEAILRRMPYVRENDILLSRLSEKFQDDFGIRRGGSLDIAVTDEEVETIRELVRMQREDTGDDEIQFLNPAELRRVSPFLSSNCLAARYRPSDGSLFPFQLIRALSFHIRERGAVIEQWTKVEEIISRDGNVEGVRTAKGVVESDCIVVATNGWTKYLLPDLPIMPLRSLAVLTEPMPPVPVFTFEAELNGKIVYGCTQTARGNLLVGGPPEKPASPEEQFDEDVSYSEVGVNSAVIPEIFPPLKRLHILRAWAGTMGITPDGLPCVGKTGGGNGLYVAAGYSNGMSWGVVTGKLLAELITHGEASIPLNTLDPNRFRNQNIRWPDTYDYTVLADFLGRIA